MGGRWIVICPGCDVRNSEIARLHAVVAAADRLRALVAESAVPEYPDALDLACDAYDEARAALGEVSTSPAPTDPTDAG